MKPSNKDFTKIRGNTTSYSIKGIMANAQKGVGQDADLLLKNLKLKILGQPHDDVLLTTDRRFKHYKANGDRINLKDRLLFRKYYGKPGSVKYYQFFIPNQLVSELLTSLHGEIGKHPGITRTIFALTNSSPSRLLRWSRRANLKLGTRHVCPRQSRLIWINHWFSRAIIH